MEFVRFFLDTEFIEWGNQLDLISIGIVDEFDKDYYAINKNCSFEKANRWVIENVFPSLGIETTEDEYGFIDHRLPTSEDYLKFYKQPEEIKKELIKFINTEVQEFVHQKTVEIWVDYGAYDFVVLSQFFGGYEQLTKYLPEFFYDLQSNSRILEAHRRFTISIHKQFPESLETKGKHHALLGAETCKRRFEVLNQWL